MFERLVNGQGRPPWLWPPPSLRILMRGSEQVIVIRYSPELAGRFTKTPARHYDDAPAQASGKDEQGGTAALRADQSYRPPTCT